MAYFTKEVNISFDKPSLNCNIRLAKHLPMYVSPVMLLNES